MRVITAAELDAMTPAEREASFEASIVRNLDDVPVEYRPRIEDMRRRLADKLAQQEQRPTS